MLRRKSFSSRGIRSWTLLYPSIYHPESTSPYALLTHGDEHSNITLNRKRDAWPCHQNEKRPEQVINSHPTTTTTYPCYSFPLLPFTSLSTKRTPFRLFGISCTIPNITTPDYNKNNIRISGKTYMFLYNAVVGVANGTTTQKRYFCSTTAPLLFRYDGVHYQQEAASEERVPIYIGRAGISCSLAGSSSSIQAPANTCDGKGGEGGVVPSPISVMNVCSNEHSAYNADPFLCMSQRFSGRANHSYISNGKEMSPPLSFAALDDYSSSGASLSSSLSSGTQRIPSSSLPPPAPNSSFLPPPPSSSSSMVTPFAASVYERSDPPRRRIGARGRIPSYAYTMMSAFSTPSSQRFPYIYASKGVFDRKKRHSSFGLGLFSEGKMTFAKPTGRGARVGVFGLPTSYALLGKWSGGTSARLVTSPSAETGASTGVGGVQLFYPSSHNNSSQIQDGAKNYDHAGGSTSTRGLFVTRAPPSSDSTRSSSFLTSSFSIDSSSLMGVATYPFSSSSGVWGTSSSTAVQKRSFSTSSLVLKSRGTRHDVDGSGVGLERSKYDHNEDVDEGTFPSPFTHTSGSDESAYEGANSLADSHKASLGESRLAASPTPTSEFQASNKFMSLAEQEALEMQSEKEFNLANNPERNARASYGVNTNHQLQKKMRIAERRAARLGRIANPELMKAADSYRREREKQRDAGGMGQWTRDSSSRKHWGNKS